MAAGLIRKNLSATGAGPKRPVKLADEGVVTAIVAVTGVVDSVNDLLVPGCFAASLKVRRPKVISDHDWPSRAGRVMHVEEWLPGDPRLPKRTKEGQPWPAAAGALVATMQYNLASEKGREAFQWVKFYAESNEAEFSIGYKVPEGMARKRADGVRVILQLQLFEFSDVLFGAAPLTMALEVKDMHGGAAGAVERPALGEVEETDGDDDKTPAPPLAVDAAWDDPEEKPMEAKTALAVVLEAKGVVPEPEAKAMSRMRGSYEERRQLIEAAARDVFDATYHDPCVCVVATYDTEAIVTVYVRDEEHSFVLPYTVSESGVELGAPDPVELSLVAEPTGGDVPAVVADPEEVEAATVLAPVLGALEQAAALAGTEGKAAARVRAAAASLFGLQAKSADQAPAEADGDTITRETLPEGDWQKFRKTQPIEALHMDGPFTVQTREGVLASEGGWLAIDSDGYPYPIAEDEMSAVYAPDTSGDSAGDQPADTGDETGKSADAGEDPDGDAAADATGQPDGDADDETGDAGSDEGGTVTLSPDDLYDPNAPEDQPSQDALDAAADTTDAAPAEAPATGEPDDSAKSADDTAPPEAETPTGDDGTVTLDPDEHFNTLDELDGGDVDPTDKAA